MPSQGPLGTCHVLTHWPCPIFSFTSQARCLNPIVTPKQCQWHRHLLSCQLAPLVSHHYFAQFISAHLSPIHRCNSNGCYPQGKKTASANGAIRLWSVHHNVFLLVLLPYHCGNMICWPLRHTGSSTRHDVAVCLTLTNLMLLPHSFLMTQSDPLWNATSQLFCHDVDKDHD